MAKRAPPNKPHLETRMRRETPQVLKVLGEKASRGFSAKDAQAAFPHLTNWGSGYISAAHKQGLIERAAAEGIWKFTNCGLKKHGSPASNQPKVWLSELRQLYLVFGKGDVLVFDRFQLVAYYLQPAAERLVQLHCSELKKMVVWLTERSGEEGLFFAADDGWLLQMAVPDEWQKEKTTLFPPVPNEEKEPAATEIAKPEEDVMETKVTVPTAKSEFPLVFPPARTEGNYRAIAYEERVRLVYHMIGSHELVPAPQWKNAVRDTSAEPMSGPAVSSWLSRLTHKDHALAIGELNDDQVWCYKWNVANLRAFFGMPPEEVSSVAEAPASAPAPSPEEASDAVVEVVQPMSRLEELREKLREVSERNAQKDEDLKRLKAEHRFAVDALQEAQLKLNRATQELASFEYHRNGLTSEVEQCKQELALEVQRIADVQVATILEGMKTLEQDIRAEVVKRFLGMSAA